MGRRTTKKKRTGPGVSDAPGPDGEGGIVPASAPSSTSVGQEVRKGSVAAPTEAEPRTPEAERLAAVAPGLKWEDMAPWWGEPNMETLTTAEAFYRSLEVQEKAEKGVYMFRRGIGLLLDMKDMGSVREQVERFSEFVVGWAQDMVWIAADHIRGECDRHMESVGGRTGSVPDLGKEFRDQGTETEKGPPGPGKEVRSRGIQTTPDPGKEVQDRGSQTAPGLGKEVRDRGIQADASPHPGKKFRDGGTQTEVAEASRAVAPVPVGLEARLEKISSKLAASSDRLELVERRLGEIAGGERVRGTLKRRKEEGAAAGEGEWVRVVRGGMGMEKRK